MKKILFLILINSFFLAQAQHISYGIRGAFFYNKARNLYRIRQGKRDIYKNKAKKNKGWQGGIFMRMGFDNGIFFQPELNYSQYCNRYKIKDKATFLSPIYRITFYPIIGIRFFRLIHLYGAPSLCINLSNKLKLNYISSYYFNRVNTGIQMGISFYVPYFNLDFRWEKDLSKFRGTFLEKNIPFFLDHRTSFFIAALGIRF